jgi:hypothetical protein
MVIEFRPRVIWTGMPNEDQRMVQICMRLNLLIISQSG